VIESASGLSLEQEIFVNERHSYGEGPKPQIGEGDQTSSLQSPRIIQADSFD
jgi:hypothetical protein